MSTAQAAELCAICKYNTVVFIATQLNSTTTAAAAAAAQRSKIARTRTTDIYLAYNGVASSSSVDVRAVNLSMGSRRTKTRALFNVDEYSIRSAIDRDSHTDSD